MPVHTYTNWNQRPSDREEQIEPFRKYFFICEGVDEVIRAFGSQVKKAVLCFTPKDTDGFEKSELHEDDTTFFVQGKFFEENHNEEYMMQAITHA